jgi:hypothetical protein
MSACTTSVPCRSVTVTGTTSSTPSVICAKSGGSSCARARNDVVAFSSTRLVFISLGYPAMAARHGGLHQHSHRHLGGVAGRDRMHGVQVVVDHEPFGHPHLGQARLHPHHVRQHRGEVGNSGHRRRGEEPGATGTGGKPQPCRICAGRACHDDISYSGVGRRDPAMRRPGAARGDAADHADRSSGRGDLADTRI